MSDYAVRKRINEWGVSVIDVRLDNVAICCKGDENEALDGLEKLMTALIMSGISKEKIGVAYRRATGSTVQKVVDLLSMREA